MKIEIRKVNQILDLINQYLKSKEIIQDVFNNGIKWQIFSEVESNEIIQYYYRRKKDLEKEKVNRY